jgi:hypothetical protein
MPAFDLPETITLAVSALVQPAAVHIYLYVPATVYPVIVVVGDVGIVITVGAGLPGTIDHVPAPPAAIVAIEPVQYIVWSGPALALGDTTILTVSVHPPEDHKYL